MICSKYPLIPYHQWASQVAQCLKNLPANAEDIKDSDSLSGSERSPERGHGNSLQYSCLEHPMAEVLSRKQSTGSQRVEHD